VWVLVVVVKVEAGPVESGRRQQQFASPSRVGSFTLQSSESGAVSSCVPLIPRLVVPLATAARACSIWTSLPDGENVVSENLRIRSPLVSTLSATLTANTEPRVFALTSTLLRCWGSTSWRAKGWVELGAGGERGLTSVGW